MSKQPIQEERNYWEVLEGNLGVLEHYTNKLLGYSESSEGENIQTINDTILDLQTLANEMVEELVEGGEE